MSVGCRNHRKNNVSQQTLCAFLREERQPKPTFTPDFSTIALTTAGFFRKCCPMEVLGAIRLLVLWAWPRAPSSFFAPVEYGIAGVMPALEDLDFLAFGMMTILVKADKE